MKFVLKDMDDMIKNPDGILAEAKILNVARDISFFIFNIKLDPTNY